MTTTYEIYTNDGGTPKAVTGNAPAIVERVEALETSVETLEETLDKGVVTSVNGKTGAVSVDVGVTSFNGSTGAVTYTAPVTSVNGQTGAVTVSASDSTKIPISGSRGNLAGYESSGTATTINASARDSNQTGSNITVSNGSANTSWTKIVRVTSAVSVTLGSSWKWVGGSAPTIKSGGILVCCWCGSGGIANFVSPS